MELVFAYIDPGSGSLIIQALIAGIVAAPILLRKQIARFVHAIRGDAPVAETNGTPDDTTQGG